MRVLVACEESQTVRNAFAARGHDAWSCDLLPASGDHPERHYQCDVSEVLSLGWDLIIGHPPCTYLAGSGMRWMYHPEDKHLLFEDRRPHPRFPDRRIKSIDALLFFKYLFNAPANAVAIENPVGLLSRYFRKPDQYVHPYFFGDPASKKTGLWLRNLPPLEATNVVDAEFVTHKDGIRSARWHYETMKLPAEERRRIRSKFWPGMANAMAEQWGSLKL